MKSFFLWHWGWFQMLNENGFTFSKIILATGLFSGFFYPHLFTEIFIYKGF